MFVLKNTKGLYIMSLSGVSRNDYSFTKDASHAMIFKNEADAQAKAKVLSRFKVAVHPLRE